MTTLNRILNEEGFNPKPYQDKFGNWTFGHGLTYITEDESIFLVKRRLREIENKLIQIVWFCRLNKIRQQVIVDMSYQMGISGMLNFKRMIAALEMINYRKAAIEILDSRYSKQTPERAKRNSELMRRGN